ncbi:MAG: hypothetical protein R3A78_12375 [Polyangiales bacterium]
MADGTATEEAVQVIQRNVKSGEYYTAEVTARSGASSYALTVQLDKVGTPPPTTSCGDKVCNGTETCSTCRGLRSVSAAAAQHELRRQGL